MDDCIISARITNRLYIGDVYTWLACCCDILPVNIVIVVVVVVLIAACGLLVRGFTTHFIALPSILRAARTSSLPCSTFIYPSTCLLRRCTPSLPPPTPSSDDARIRTIFPIPTRLRSLLAPPLPSARAFFIYSVNSRTNTTGSITMNAPFLGPR